MGKLTLIMQNKANFQNRRQKTEDRKQRFTRLWRDRRQQNQGKSTPKLRLSVPPSRTKLSSVALMN